MMQPLPTENKPTTQIAPITLHYYQIRGVAQPIRILCHCLNIKFVDNFLQKNAESQLESGFRIGVPMIEDGQIKVYEQIAIINYLCTRANQQSLLGLTPQHNAKINEMLFKYSVQKKKIMSSIMEGLKAKSQEGNSKEAGEVALRKIVEESKFIQVCLSKITKNRKFVFDYLTVVDFLFYEICFYIDGFYKEYINKDSEYWGFTKFKSQFEKQEFFAKNKSAINQIPLFFQFSSPMLNEIVSKSWKSTGCKNIFVKSMVQE